MLIVVDSAAQCGVTVRQILHSSPSIDSRCGKTCHVQNCPRSSNETLHTHERRSFCVSRLHKGSQNIAGSSLLSQQRLHRCSLSRLALFSQKHVGLERTEEHANMPLAFKFSAVASLNAALQLLVLLRCTSITVVDAFVAFRPSAAVSEIVWSRTNHRRTDTLPTSSTPPPLSPRPSRSHMTSLPKRIRSVPLSEAVPATPVPRTRCHAMHGNNYADDDDRAGGGDDIHNLDAPGQQQRHHCGGAPVGIGDDVAASRDNFGEQGGGFGWLREFGNGKTDIAGLVLSTVLLMTAVGAPLG